MICLPLQHMVQLWLGRPVSVARRGHPRCACCTSCSSCQRAQGSAGCTGRTPSHCARLASRACPRTWLLTAPSLDGLAAPDPVAGRDRTTTERRMPKARISESAAHVNSACNSGSSSAAPRSSAPNFIAANWPTPGFGNSAVEYLQSALTAHSWRCSGGQTTEESVRSRIAVPNQSRFMRWESVAQGPDVVCPCSSADGFIGYSLLVGSCATMASVGCIGPGM